MSRDDVFYLCILLVSIPLGHVIKLFGTQVKLKQFLVCISGLLFSFILVGHTNIYHSLVVVTGNFAIIKLLSFRICHYVSFIFTFAYLLFFRTCHLFGLKQPTGQSNALQLLITLRMISVAFEHHDQETKKRSESEDQFETFRVKEDFHLQFLDLLTYGYSYIGLFTGPFYTYSTFIDMIYQDARNISTVWPAIRNLKALPLIVVPYLFLAKNFPIAYMETEEYLNHKWGVVYQLFILVPTFTWFRWRFYIGWLLAEAMCITAGLGAYPVECKNRPAGGPTLRLPEGYDWKETNKKHNGEAHDFETTHNINIYEVELAPTMRACMKDWNMTVQWWMATYVYKKLPFKSAQLRMFLLLFVSAFWHGVHPGYYLTFVSVPMVVMAETRMSKVIKPYLNEKLIYWWDWVTWFCLYRSFEYLGVGFMLLRLESIWRVWARMYFIGHVFILLFIILPAFIPRKRVKEKEKSG